MSKRKKYILVKKYIKDLELDCHDELFSELKINDNDDMIDLIIKNDEKISWSGESAPIKIKTLINELTEFYKVHKCEFVEIMFHEDHNEYVLTGLQIEKHNENTPEYKSLLKNKKSK
jgi:hypothetical protein